MKLFTKLALCMVIVAIVSVVIVTLFSIKKQTETLETQGVPSESIGKANRAVIRYSIYLVPAALALSTSIALALSRRLTNTIARITHATQRVAAFDLEHSVQVDSEDELGALARSFNNMMRSLHTSWEQLRSYGQSLEAEIVEREQVERALRESEHRCRAILELSPQAIILLDSKGKVLDSNRRLYEWFGHKPEEIIGMNLSEVPYLPEESKAKATEASLRSFGHGILACEADFTITNGEKRIGRIIANPMINDRGEVSRVLLMICDVTEYRRLEKALRESVEREAYAYDRGRSEIVDTILHNIGNAINSVNIGIGTIRESITSNKLVHYFICLADAVRKHQDEFGDYVKNDPQGQRVASFIIALADDFAEHNERLVKTVSRVHERAEHIADIIRTEDTFSSKE